MFTKKFDLDTIYPLSAETLIKISSIAEPEIKIFALESVGMILSQFFSHLNSNSFNDVTEAISFLHELMEGKIERLTLMYNGLTQEEMRSKSDYQKTASAIYNMVGYIQFRICM